MSSDGKVPLAGSDGKDDGRIFIVHSCLGYEIIDNGGSYDGEVGNTEYMTEITHIQEFGMIEKAIDEANADGCERGMNKEATGDVQVWEKGSEVSKNENGNLEHSMQPFNIKDREYDVETGSKSLWYMHVHPTNDASPAFGTSQPSGDDTGFDQRFRNAKTPFKGTAFVVGGGDKKVTFYNGENIITTLLLEQLQEIISNCRDGKIIKGF